MYIVNQAEVCLLCGAKCSLGCSSRTLNEAVRGYGSGNMVATVPECVPWMMF